MRLLLGIIQFTLVCAVPKFHNEISKHDKQSVHEREELIHLKTMVQELTKKIADQDVMIKELIESDKRQEDALSQLKIDTVKQIEEMVASKLRPTKERRTETRNATIHNTEKKINQNAAPRLKPKGGRQMRAQNATIFNQKTDVACLMDSVYLTCSSPSEIFITGAIYGYYDKNCTETCCEPHPTNDCQGDVVDYDTEAWISLNGVCNNETSCEFQYQGGVIPECSNPDSFADYMSVSYSCFPVDPNEVVAFTAYTYDTGYYTDGEIIGFEYTYSNLGGYYDSSSGLFRCPYNGLYQFTANIMTRYGEGLEVYIMKDGSVMVSAWADDYDPYSGTVYLQSGNTVLTQCEAGELVWVESFSSGYLYINSRSTAFSGVLLHRMDN